MRLRSYEIVPVESDRKLEAANRLARGCLCEEMMAAGVDREVVADYAGRPQLPLLHDERESDGEVCYRQSLAVVQGDMSGLYAVRRDLFPRPRDYLTLYVNPYLRGRGIGGELFRAYTAECLDPEGQVETVVDVQENLPGMLRFFTKRGFSIEGNPDSKLVRTTIVNTRNGLEPIPVPYVRMIRGEE